MLRTLFRRDPQPATVSAADHKFGTFAGVFTPTILTVLGVIMYLRLGWVVGNAGLGGAVIIILLAHVITVCTGLAVSSISTNTRVGAGGAFAIISQSLGLEIGGSVGVPLYFAQGISVALYVLGFAEGLVSIFPEPATPIIEILTNVWFVSLVTFFVVVLIAFISAQFAARIQFIIIIVIFLSIVSIFAGTFKLQQADGFVLATPVLFGDFSDKGNDFWGTFAIFFPAVTGIMSGISMSGSLKDPRRSIPVGTMTAIVLGLVIYVSLAIWLGFFTSPEELLSNSTILVDKAWVGELVLAGMLGATFSSALGSIVAAPRVMQALAIYRVVPLSNSLKKETPSGDPRQATLLTAVIALVALVFALYQGGLDAVASVISMFFLIAYAMLNVVVLIEQTLSMVSFRPTFSVPRIIPFVGMTGCIFVMFLIDPIFTIVAIAVVIGIYGYLARRNLTADLSDVRSGLFSAVAEWATIKSNEMPAALERKWKPTVLVPVEETQILTGSYRFLWAMTFSKGAVYPLGIYHKDSADRLEDLEWLTAAFQKDGVYARATLLEVDDFVQGVRSATQILRHTFFRPNILFYNLRPDSEVAMVTELINRATTYRMGIVMLARHPVVELGRESLITVWLQYREQDWEVRGTLSNLHLPVLLAMQLAKNWDAQIYLCTAVADPALELDAESRLHDLIDMARLPRKTTQVRVLSGSFETVFANAPRADLNIFGLSDSVEECHEIVELVNGSCVFVRDSGEESIFA
ncbi:MAG: amino acid permease [Candidatus Promineifilaceae bacterium]